MYAFILLWCFQNTVPLAKYFQCILQPSLIFTALYKDRSGSACCSAMRSAAGRTKLAVSHQFCDAALKKAMHCFNSGGTQERGVREGKYLQSCIALETIRGGRKEALKPDAKHVTIIKVHSDSCEYQESQLTSSQLQKQVKAHIFMNSQHSGGQRFTGEPSSEPSPLCCAPLQTAPS